MGPFAVGKVVLVPFSFSDLTASKLRLALILADASRDDWICSQITSNPYADATAIELADSHFSAGSLARISYIRSGKLFTTNSSLFQHSIATLNEAKLKQALASVIALFSL